MTPDATSAARGVRSTGVAIPVVLAFVALAFALALTKVQDHDAWTHLAFGRWIWENGRLPAAEPFVSTGPTLYTNWLFGFAYYVAYHLGGIPGVIVLKAAIVAGLFSMLFAESLRPSRNHLVAFAVFFAVVVWTRARFVERPDTFMMLFIAYTVLALGAFLRDGDRRWLYGVPLVHVLWANTHTSLPMMVVPFVAFLVAGAIQRAVVAGPLAARLSRLVSFADTPTPAQLRTVAWVFGASALASLLNPYGTDQWTLALGALKSDWWTQEVVELRPPTWATDKYLYVFTALLVASFVLNRRRLSLIDAALALPFAVLPFTAYRFVWFTAITAVFLVRNVSAVLDARPRQAAIARAPSTAIVSVGLAAAFALLHALQVKPLDFFRHQHPGFGVEHALLPEGALAYMDRVGVAGGVYNLFQWGGYIVWRDFPRRKPVIDGRGYLDAALLEKVNGARYAPGDLDALRRQQGFESVLVEFPEVRDGLAQMTRGDLAFAHPGWALVYWDDLSLLYLRRGGPYDEVIRRDEYRHVIPSRGLQLSALAEPGRKAGAVAELQRNARQTGSSTAHLWLGILFNDAGRYAEAIEAFAKVRNTALFVNLPFAYAGMAEAHRGLGDVDQAIAHYRRAIDVAPDPAPMIQELASVLEEKGDRLGAIEHYEKVLELGRNRAYVQSVLARLYQAAGRTADAEKMRAAIASSQVILQAMEHFQAATRAYLERRYGDAIAQYEASIRINPGNPAPYSNLGFLYFDLDKLDKADEYHRRALAIDRNTANSHYGLALVYKRAGDRPNALRHWEAYLRLEPVGRYSRKAKEEIEELRR